MKNGAGVFVFVCLCIVLLCSLAWFGLDAIGLKGITEEGGITKGLDLVGGSSIVYQAETEEGTDLDMTEMATAMNTVVTMLRQRLDTLGYTEATVAMVGTDRVRVEIPGIDNPEEAVQKLGSTAKLQFVDSNGKVVLEGADIKKAQAAYGQISENGADEHYVSLELNSEAIEKFADATEEMAKLQSSGKNYISITLDGEAISSPSVSERIYSESCVISGSYDAADSQWLASIISAGQMPLVLRDIELRSVGPTLGMQALETSLIAGVIGIILVIIFMILVYRLLGVISSIALIAYMGIFGLLLVLFNVNLSLPGIAGIILTIGMAVDSNVIIFERIKEELSIGKSIRASVKSGFDRAFAAILDANVTTIIAAVVLMIFGSGTVQGFAITLFIGVIVSLFMTLVITKILLNAVVGMNVKNIWLFAAKLKKHDA